jgi:hypothetical protein
MAILKFKQPEPASKKERLIRYIKRNVDGFFLSLVANILLAASILVLLMKG